MTADIHSEIEDVVSEFEFLDDWEQRYRHLIDMGRALPPLDPAERNEDTRVKGCVSQLWLVHERDGPRIVFRAESDAHIVRGLAALMLRIYSGRTPEDIRAVDARAVLARISLAEHLSPQRSNGLNAMIARIQDAAA